MNIKKFLFMISLALILTACGGGSSNKTGNQSSTTHLPRSADYMLSAWNDLGMHCMDGNDFSVFSILPPYNNLHAQLKDKNGKLISSGVTISYE